ncbi:GIY-YIG nuclease family protein [Enterococcus italicus]|uniref:GIY-YIG nuclease family protein n=1 Tax=Enterococcus italicus TaxID=246144 RepID=UPI0020734C98|nr:GIY-YIG nuclease family protein [Enterococcus italicus]MCM6930548.1 GIY-YIG nuclease family protein [Enterococcus italicus]
MIIINNWYYYVLQLSNGMYYVGITTDIANRIREHTYKEKKSAAFTKKFAVEEVIEIKDIGLTNANYAKKIEREVTIQYMQEKGWKNVRGSDYATSSEHLVLERLIYDIHNKTIQTTTSKLQVSNSDLYKCLLVHKDRATLIHKKKLVRINLKDVKAYCKYNKIKQIDSFKLYRDISLQDFLNIA